MDTLEVTSRESSAAARMSATAFIPLPIPSGNIVRILGPDPARSATAVNPLIKLDTPVGVFQSFIAGACTPDGELIEPMELMLVDPQVSPDCDPIPLAAVFDRVNNLPELFAQLPVRAGCDLASRALGSAAPLGPLLYCRKRHMVFLARSPDTLKPLTRVPASAHSKPSRDRDLPSRDREGAVASNTVHADHASPPDTPGTESPNYIPELLAWDGPVPDGQTARIYGGTGGVCEYGEFGSIEQLVKDQGIVATRAADIIRRDPLLFAELEREHACCTRDERELAKLSAGGYDFVLERLAVLSAGQTQVLPIPLGEFSLNEAARIIGRTPPSQALGGEADADNAFETWRKHRCRQIESSAPALLLSGESDGRDLVEVCRLKLGLIEQAFSRLAQAWQVSGRAHLCWNEHTIRVAWRTPLTVPATCWGFASILRKIGLQPATDIQNHAGETMAYPPVFSDDALLAPETIEAGRYFGRERKANVFIKKATPDGEKAVTLHLLLEDTGIPRRLFCFADVMHVTGDGWQAALAPAAEHNPDDGEGLPFVGRARGRVAALKNDASIEGCTYTWYPRFAEAVDLHALGMLLFETLLAHDQRAPERLREAILAERTELQNACKSVDAEQRNHEALVWIAGRCESDAPASVWSRRNVVALRDDRAAARLDVFPPLLWQALIAFGFRMITAIPGFSFCPGRDHDVPRSGAGQVVPLLELRGQIAMFDDIIFGRTAAMNGLRAAVSSGGAQ